MQILTSWIQLASSAVDSILLGSKVSEETLAAAIKVKQAKYITKDIGDSFLALTTTEQIHKFELLFIHQT